MTPSALLLSYSCAGRRTTRILLFSNKCVWARKTQHTAATTEGGTHMVVRQVGASQFTPRCLCPSLRDIPDPPKKSKPASIVLACAVVKVIPRLPNVGFDQLPLDLGKVVPLEHLLLCHDAKCFLFAEGGIRRGHEQAPRRPVWYRCFALAPQCAKLDKCCPLPLSAPSRP